jgi:hypothetical protein
LVREETVSAREVLGRDTDLVGEINGFLVDEEFFECECHGLVPLYAMGWFR